MTAFTGELHLMTYLWTSGYLKGTYKKHIKENSYGVQLVDLLYFVIKRKLLRSNF